MSALQKPVANTLMYLENIISLMPGHIYWKDRNGVFLGCNDEQAKFIGLSSRKDIVGLTAYDTLPHDFAEEVMRIDREVMEAGISKTIEEVLTLPNGQKSIWLSKKVPLRNEKNEIVGILGISFDITEKKHTEKELIETQTKLESMTLVGASIAHELRTPLASINIGIGTLKTILPHLFQSYRLAAEAGLPITKIGLNDLTDFEREIVSIDKEVKTSQTFINMLLLNLNPTIDQSRIEMFSIHDCIDEALSRYPFTRTQQALIKWEKAKADDFAIKGEFLLVVHVFFNLIKNALFYLAKAGKGDIEIWTEKGHPYNKVFFKDTGTGIPTNMLPHIFERFFSKTHHGAGVGLTFCQWVMENLGGEITCESEEGNYTLFILSFPDLNLKD